MKKSLPLLTVVLFLAGCVNLHVHFPEAPPDKAAGSATPAPAGAAK